eukprot:gnl/TRDRNA2_/TRDRNA2_174895_c0_seq2.p1 gnl/TRDRNA2_/TRDRNA2_174895_c0~~gnl/TRDRNA2_/TRDRNA2_174895_c0_seq2.p1  ORF type:complete len:267 (+),score=54.13 gnl/TRDRNA2_/TRDRNA2_174895_c0_seq2:60-860(+)
MIILLTFVIQACAKSTVPGGENTPTKSEHWADHIGDGQLKMVDRVSRASGLDCAHLENTVLGKGDRPLPQPCSRLSAARRLQASKGLKGPYDGKIKSFSFKDNYGFIESPAAHKDFGGDVFIHIKQMDDFKVGEAVTFHVHKENGKPQARNVKGADEKKEKNKLEKLEGPFTGRIKSFNHKRGWGLISCEEASEKYGGDVWIWKNQLDVFDTNDEVTFYVEKNEGGRPQARKVTGKKEGGVKKKRKQDGQKRDGLKQKRKGGGAQS